MINIVLFGCLPPVSSKHQQKNQRKEQSAGSPDRDVNHSEKSIKFPLGVYMLENRPTPNSVSERLAIARELCVKNANVYYDSGQKGKVR